MKSTRATTGDIVLGLVAVLSDRLRELYPGDIVGIDRTRLHESIVHLKEKEEYKEALKHYTNMNCLNDGISDAVTEIFPGKVLMSANASRERLSELEQDYKPEVKFRELLDRMSEDIITYFREINAIH